MSFRIKNIMLILLLGCITSCNESASDKVKQKEIKYELSSRQLQIGEELEVLLKDLEKGEKVEFSGAVPIQQNGEDTYIFRFDQAGSKNIHISAIKGNQSRIGRINISVYPGRSAESLSYELVNVYEHDDSSYTQGLEVSSDTIYESKGQYGTSAIRKYILGNRRLIKEFQLPVNHFGEGLSKMSDTIYQLTWREGLCYLYNTQLERLGSLALPTAEGWGLCNDGERLYLSDGSNRLQILDSKFNILQTLQIFNGKLPLLSINELEYAEGMIWANVYQSEKIYLINPATGAAEHYIDLSDLRKQLSSKHAEVLNGIAFRKKENTLLITGKYWDKMFEIKIKKEYIAANP